MAITQSSHEMTQMPSSERSRPEAQRKIEKGSTAGKLLRWLALKVIGDFKKPEQQKFDYNPKHPIEANRNGTADQNALYEEILRQEAAMAQDSSDQPDVAPPPSQGFPVAV